MMGNTYLSLFFAMSHDNNDLDAALKAYRKSEEVEAHKKLSDPDNFKLNPDLYFNRAQVLVYLEDFEAAVADYKIAKQLDPESSAEDRISDIGRRISGAAELVAKKGHLKAKRLTALAQSLGTDTNLDAKLERAPNGDAHSAVAVNSINELVPGGNAQKRIDLKLLGPLGRAGDTPVSFLVMDRQENLFGLSVYHLDASAQAKIKQDKDRITIVDPVLKVAKLDDHQYTFLQVKSPLHFFVNGKLLNANIAHAALNSTSR
jgi:tetratricopeptide (TPR) repeat protein